MFSNAVFAINASDVATIDMRLAISLHPKMALYDYNRMGFYKVNLGLSDEEFKSKVEELKKLPIDVKAEREKLVEELKQISIQREIYEQQQYSPKRDITEEYLKNCETFDFKILELSQKIMDLDWRVANPDLTSRNETKQIMNEIKKDIFVAIKQVVDERKYLLVLNSSIFVPHQFDLKFHELVYGQGMPGVNLSLFYAFFWRNMVYSSPELQANRTNKKVWKELTQQLDSSNALPISNYPFVLSGGVNIMTDVLKKVYSRYNIEPSVAEMVASVTERIECLQKGKQIEKLVVILDEK